MLTFELPDGQGKVPHLKGINAAEISSQFPSRTKLKHRSATTALLSEMLFSKFTGLTILAVATTSFAQSCCNSISSSSNPVTSALLGLLGIVVQGVNVPIGIGCSPVTVSRPLTSTAQPCNIEPVI